MSKSKVTATALLKFLEEEQRESTRGIFITSRLSRFHKERPQLQTLPIHNLSPSRPVVDSATALWGTQNTVSKFTIPCRDCIYVVKSRRYACTRNPLSTRLITHASHTTRGHSKATTCSIIYLSSALIGELERIAAFGTHGASVKMSAFCENDFNYVMGHSCIVLGQECRELRCQMGIYTTHALLSRIDGFKPYSRKGGYRDRDRVCAIFSCMIFHDFHDCHRITS